MLKARFGLASVPFCMVFDQVCGVFLTYSYTYIRVYVSTHIHTKMPRRTCVYMCVLASPPCVPFCMVFDNACYCVVCGIETYVTCVILLAYICIYTYAAPSPFDRQNPPPYYQTNQTNTQNTQEGRLTLLTHPPTNQQNQTPTKQIHAHHRRGG